MENIDKFLDDISSRRANHFECLAAVQERIRLDTQVDWVDALRRAITRQEKMYPDSTRMRTLYNALAVQLLELVYKKDGD